MLSKQSFRYLSGPKRELEEAIRTQLPDLYFIRIQIRFHTNYYVCARIPNKTGPGYTKVFAKAYSQEGVIRHLREKIKQYAQ